MREEPAVRELKNGQFDGIGKFVDFFPMFKDDDFLSFLPGYIPIPLFENPNDPIIIITNILKHIHINETFLNQPHHKILQQCQYIQTLNV